MPGGRRGSPPGSETGKLRPRGSEKPRCGPQPSPPCPRIPGSLRARACQSRDSVGAGPSHDRESQRGIARTRAAVSAGGASRAGAGGRPLPGRAARAPKFGRLLPSVLRLQGRTSGEFRRNPSGSSAELCLCPAHRLAGDTNFRDTWHTFRRGLCAQRSESLGPHCALLLISPLPPPVTCLGPPAPLESITSFLLQNSPRGGIVSPIFLRIWFTRNCLSGESYFSPVYLALSLN